MSETKRIESYQQTIIPIKRQEIVFHLVFKKNKYNTVIWCKRKVRWESYVLRLSTHGDDGLYFASEEAADLRLKELRRIYEETKAKSTAEKMAEFIFNAGADCCRECCADFERCEAEMRELSRAAADVNYTPPLPPKSHCIANIIKFFEVQGQC